MEAAVGRRNIKKPQLTQPRLRVAAAFRDLVVACRLLQEPRADRDGSDERHARHQPVEARPIEGIIPHRELQKAVVVREAGHELSDDD